MAKKKRSRSSRLTPEQHAEREEQRRRARLERQEAAAAEAKRQKRKSTLRKVLTGTFVGVAVGAAAILVFRAPSELPGVVRPTELPNEVLAEGETFDYDSPTPTSGPNPDTDPTCGVFEELSPEEAVNVLAAGGVVLWYDAARTDLRQPLETIAADFEDGVAVAPNAELDDPVVATAWGRLKLFDAPGGEVTRFIDVYLGRGPQPEPCPTS